VGGKVQKEQIIRKPSARKESREFKDKEKRVTIAKRSRLYMR
jgi:hypothetical protein